MLSAAKHLAAPRDRPFAQHDSVGADLSPPPPIYRPQLLANLPPKVTAKP
jgi:hypothetical protein